MPVVKSHRLLLAIGGILLFTLGCSEVGLYSNLPEKEVNEMMAILADNGIHSTKVPGEEGKWNVTVEEARYADAVAILSDLGRPREQRPTIDELFPKTGFTSSPTEQRIRLTYGLAQSLEKTIANLPGGVINASVHLVLPENNPFSETAQPSRANVTVIHRRGAQIENAIPTIKEIVIGAVDGLEVDNVTVELIEADESLSSIRNGRKNGGGPEMTNILSVQVAKSSAMRLIVMLGIAGAGLVLGLVLTVNSLFRRGRTASGSN